MSLLRQFRTSKIASGRADRARGTISVFTRPQSGASNFAHQHDRTISVRQNDRVCALALGLVNQVPAVHNDSFVRAVKGCVGISCCCVLGR